MTEAAAAERLRTSVSRLADLRRSKALIETEIEEIENLIHRLAIEDLRLVETPEKWKAKQFRCNGQVVQLTVSGDEILQRRRVSLYEIGHLPEVP